MNKHSLNKDEFIRFINEFVSNSHDNSDDELSTIIEQCKCYENELHCLTYYVSLISQILKKKKSHQVELIEKIYDIPNQASFYLEEMDEEFTDFMINHNRKSGLTLEDNLNYIHLKYLNNEHDEKIRY